jgi:hypothetical protein
LLTTGDSSSNENWASVDRKLVDNDGLGRPEYEKKKTKIRTRHYYCYYEETYRAGMLKTGV